MGDYFLIIISKALITRSLGIIDSPGVVQQLDLIRDPRVVTVFLLTPFMLPRWHSQIPVSGQGRGGVSLHTHLLIFTFFFSYG